MKGHGKNMKNDSLIKWTISGLIVLTFVVVIALVLVGDNGLIKQEVKKYNDTHTEEIVDKDNKKVVVYENN